MISTSEGQLSQVKTEARVSNNPVALLEAFIEMKQRIQVFTPYEPITINSNDEFETHGFLGTGSWNDPYRIEGYNITDSNSDLIIIKNTTVTFRIANNYLNGMGTASTGSRQRSNS